MVLMELLIAGEWGIVLMELLMADEWRGEY